MNGLVKATELQMPNISGTVSVPLAELDRMRAEHVQAVKLAQDLESRQMEVRITLLERVQDYRYNSRGDRGHFIEDRTQKVEFRNLDIVISDLRIEENKKIEEKYRESILSKDRAITNYAEAIYNKTAKIEEYEANIKQLNESAEVDFRTICSLEEGVSVGQALVIERNETIRTQDRMIEQLEEQLRELRQAKTFWGWMTNNNR